VHRAGGPKNEGIVSVWAGQHRFRFAIHHQVAKRGVRFSETGLRTKVGAVQIHRYAVSGSAIPEALRARETALLQQDSPEQRGFHDTPPLSRLRNEMTNLTKNEAMTWLV
jgi:hypothetical protein